MKQRLAGPALLCFAIAPFAVLAVQGGAGQAPTAEQVFKNIKVFKGTPASDIIPAMQFMSASMKFQCVDCHDPKDYAADTRAIETTRKMILMQREINEKHFNGRLEVTCNSCHGGKEHPEATPIPAGVNLRHERLTTAPKVEDLFKKHQAASGKAPVMLTRSGTLTAPNDETHSVETNPLEFVQAEGGKFSLVSASRKVVADGTKITYGGNPMVEEPAAVFNRIGRAWMGEKAFEGLERLTVAGKDKVGNASVLVVRGARPASTSTEELYFDEKSGLLTRLVNIKRSSVGTVLMVVDYQNYKNVSGSKVPMKVVVTFAGDEKWEMNFKSAKVSDKVDDTIFK